jgi:probable F420-dependent oxidoreductase
MVDRLGGPLDDKYRRTHDPFVALAFAAAATEKLVVGTSVCLVIEHDPIVLAKEIASLQNLSGGRFVFGVGAGWNKPEMRNHGTDPATRHGNMRERVEAIKAIWRDDEAEYHGKHVNFDPIWQWPKPSPAPPVLIGGNGPAVEDRVLRYGDGWMPNMKELDTLGPRISALRARAGRHVPVTYYGASVATLDALREAGVDRALIVLESGPDPSIPSLA